MESKTLATYLADLRLDLKDSGALWSAAELTRCIERAVGDYTRFLPREMSKEITVDAEITDESFTTPAVADVDYFVDNEDISAFTDGSTCTIANGTPDTPRKVVITVTDANASITVLVLTVQGYDVDNKYMEERFYLSGGLIQYGVKEFALVSGVVADEFTGGSAGDALDVGTGDADGTYVQLAYRPIKFGSETVSSGKLDTDYIMDYYRGRIAMKDGGSIVVSTVYTITYTRSRIDIDLSAIITDVLKVERVEYPVGSMPQKFNTPEVWGNILTLTGGHDTQQEMSDYEHAIVKYYTSHSAPNAQSPASYSPVHDFSVELAAGAYALFMKALQYEHQAVTDQAAARTILAAAGSSDAFVAAKASLALADSTLDSAIAAAIWTKISTALDAIATAAAAADAFLVAASGQTPNTYLAAGVPFIDAVNDGKDVPENYASYAQRASELAATILQEASVYTNEAVVRLSQSDKYTAAGRTWVEQALANLATIDRYTQQAAVYMQSASTCFELSDRFRAEALERRNEAWSIWLSPSQMAAAYAMGMRGQPA